VTATYASQPVTPTPFSGALAVIQMQAADANTNVLGMRAVSTQDVNIRSSTDGAIVSASPGSLYADGGDHRSHLTIILRDSGGNILPDGTRAAISVAPSGSIVGCCYVSSAGGSLLNGAALAEWRKLRARDNVGWANFARLQRQWSLRCTNQTQAAVVQVLARHTAGSIPPQLLQCHWYGRPSLWSVAGGSGHQSGAAERAADFTSPAFAGDDTDVHDARGNLVPDGANIGVSVAASDTIFGCCYVSSAGGTILGWNSRAVEALYALLPADLEWFCFDVSDRWFNLTSPGQTATAALQLAMVNPSGAAVDNYAITVRNLVLVPPSNAVGMLRQQGGLIATLVDRAGRRSRGSRPRGGARGGCPLARRQRPRQPRQPRRGRAANGGPRRGVRVLVEAIYEGYLLHYGSPRVVRAPDADLRLLAGDRLYAIGLARLVELGDTPSVAELADTITLSALAQGAGERQLADAIWLAGARAVGWGSTEAHRNAKRLVSAGAPGGDRGDAQQAPTGRAVAGRTPRPRLGRRFRRLDIVRGRCPTSTQSTSPSTPPTA